MEPLKESNTDFVIVLAMHGAHPLDFPKPELLEFFQLHMMMEYAPKMLNAQKKDRYDELAARMRTWPRTAKNDPFFASSQALADQLSKLTGYEAFVGFNEFCDPSLDHALDQAALCSPKTIIIVTPMMTPGGQHSEVDIPVAINLAQERHPAIQMAFIWPFALSEVAQFLAGQIDRCMKEDSKS